VGMVVVGVGCAPVYPCIIHMTPSVFGKEKSQAMIGVQMAFAYVGFLVMPPLFGVMAEHLSVALLPVFLAVLLALVVALHEVVVRSAKHQN
ncbi:MAG: MFS transporter, partial [Clostridia bacterium]|nr:MFS transporter [Clostridia bacterium]